MKNREAQPEKTKRSWLAVLLAAALLLPILFQGGYYPTIFLGTGVVLAAALLASRGPCGLCGGILWVLAGLYLAASLAQGYAADSLAQAALPLVCVLFLSDYQALEAESRVRVLAWCIAASGVFAAAALLAFAGILPLAGAVTSRRLQFTFQYANAAGSWFAAMALLAQDSGDKKLRRWFLPLTSTLLLTRSVGALGLYAVAQAVRLYLRRREGVWPETILLHALAGVFAVALIFVKGWWALPLIALLYAAGWVQERLLAWAVRRHLQWGALAIGVAGAVAVFWGRNSAIGTLAERLAQILDGLKIIARHPILGVGAGNWEIFYPYCQFVQYVSSVVHSSLVQIGVDAGIPAMALCVLFFILAWRSRRRSLSQSLAAGLLAAHSLMDFTLQFIPIASLLLALLFVGEPRKESPAPVPAASRGMRIAAGILAGSLCAGLLWSELTYKRLVYTAQAGDWTAVAEGCNEHRALFGRSRAARALEVQARYTLEDWDAVLDLTQDVDRLATGELPLRAQALEQSGQMDAACTLLLEQLSRQPCRPALYERAGELLLEWRAADEDINAFNRLAEQANQRRFFLGDLMGDQVEIDCISK